MTFEPSKYFAQRDDADKRARIKKEYADLPEGALAAKTPKELVEWQAKYPPESAQHILAIQEWNRRLIETQVRWMKFSVIIGFIGVIVGAFLTAVLSPKPSDKSDGTTGQYSQKENTKQPPAIVIPPPVSNSQTKTTEPNKAPEPTIMAVTPAAEPPSRQP